MKYHTYVILTLLLPLFLGIYLSFSNEKSMYMNSTILAGEYLINHIDEDGKYVYEYDPLKRESSDSYNILRHAGTTYSLLEIYERTGDIKLLNASERAIQYLIGNTKDCIGIKDAKCIVERNETKLGGNALAILALSKYMEVTNSKTYLEYTQNLAQFIIQTQDKDGNFTSHIVDANTGEILSFESSYYPGEAIFALSRLYKIDRNEKWIEAAHKGGKWLIEVRDKEKNENTLPHDHWLLYALNELHMDNRDSIYVVHSKKIVDAILRIQNFGYVKDLKDWNGSYYKPPTSTATATRNEGLFSAYKIFLRENETEYLEKILPAIKSGIDFQLKTQINSEDIIYLDLDPKSLGAFTNSLDNYEIRIDYVQHNISAILGYIDILSY